MAITKLGLYNAALIQVKTSVLTALTDDRDERYSLDALYDLNAVDYCLEVIKPRFATKTTKLTGAATTGGVTLAYTHTLPADFVTIVEVYSDAELDQPVNRYVQEGSTIVCDYSVVYLRYVHNTVTEADFTPGFSRVVSNYLAREICAKYNADEYENVDKSLQDIVELVSAAESAKEPDARPAVQGSVLSDAWRIIYNGALTILGKDKLPAGDTDHPYRVKLDSAVNAGAVISVMEDTAWTFGLDSDKIGYDADITPSWGYQYAIQKPADLLRLDGLFSDELMNYPIKDYVDEGNYFFCSYQEVFIKYVSTSWISQPSSWPTYFSRLVMAQLAKDVAPGIDPKLINHSADTYIERRDSAMSNDAIQSPPQKIHGGEWLASRGGWRRRNGDRP